MMLQRVTSPLGFLTGAAGISFRFRLAVLLLFIGGVIPIAIVIASWPIFRQYSYAMLLWLLTFAIANLSLQGTENANWMSMLSLSQEYARAGTGAGVVFEGLAGPVRASWKWAHYTHLLVVVSWMFLLFGFLYRYALAPRAMAALGMVAALLQISGITLPQFAGYSVGIPLLFGLPLGLIYLALSIWLMVKGFNEGTPQPANGISSDLSSMAAT
jgi:hypothetical protein